MRLNVIKKSLNHLLCVVLVSRYSLAQQIIDDCATTPLADQLQVFIDANTQDTLNKINCVEQIVATDIPDLSPFTNLNEVVLRKTQLTGELPATLFTLNNLESLDLEGNQLVGTIPPEIGNLQSLERLSIPYNNFSGEFPPEIGNLQNLNFLIILPNEFEGVMPNHLATTTDAPPNFDFLLGSVPIDQGNDVNNNDNNSESSQPGTAIVAVVSVVSTLAVLGIVMVYRSSRKPKKLPPPPRNSKMSYGWFSKVYGRSGKVKTKPKSGWVLEEIQQQDPLALESAKLAREKNEKKKRGHSPKRKAKEYLEDDEGYEGLNLIGAKKFGSKNSLYADIATVDTQRKTVEETMGELTTDQIVQKKKKKKKKRKKNLADVSGSKRYYNSKRSVGKSNSNSNYSSNRSQRVGLENI